MSPYPYHNGMSALSSALPSMVSRHLHITSSFACYAVVTSQPPPLRPPPLPGDRGVRNDTCLPKLISADWSAVRIKGRGFNWIGRRDDGTVQSRRGDAAANTTCLRAPPFSFFFLEFFFCY